MKDLKQYNAIVAKLEYYGIAVSDDAVEEYLSIEELDVLEEVFRTVKHSPKDPVMD